MHPKTVIPQVSPHRGPMVVATWLWDPDVHDFTDEMTETTIEVRTVIGAEDGGVRLLTLASAGTSPVTARMLRRLPLGGMAMAARADAIAQWGYVPDFVDEHDVAELRELADEIRPVVDHLVSGGGWVPQRAGRRARPDIDYARAAARYVELLDQLVEQPTHVLADELALSATQTRSLLGQARARGLLTKAPAGRAGGRLTPKAIELLRGEA